MKLKITNIKSKDYDLILDAISETLLKINKNARYGKKTKNVGVLRVVQLETELQ